MAGEEARKQARLADSGLAFDQDDARLGVSHRLHLGGEGRQLGRPADEMVHLRRVRAGG
jgi:hypothetical protein